MNEDYTDDKLARMVGPGWFPLIKTLRDAANARDIEILQVKEKFGTLRFYYTPYGHDEVFDLAVIGAETESAHVCEECGSGGFHGGDPAGLAAQFDEIAGLGATAIWITPVARQIDYCPPSQPPAGVTVPGGWFEHCAFHGYWADDYQTLDPRFGTEAELEALVDAAHARGIKVLLDVVYNHVGYDSRYLKDPARAGWFRTRPVDCAADPLTCQVGGLPDFRTELPEVQDYLRDAQRGLAARTGLDGFRLDTVKHVEHEFWQRHRRETRAVDCTVCK